LGLFYCHILYTVELPSAVSCGTAYDGKDTITIQPEHTP